MVTTSIRHKHQQTTDNTEHRTQNCNSVHNRHKHQIKTNMKHIHNILVNTYLSKVINTIPLNVNHSVTTLPKQLVIPWPNSDQTMPRPTFIFKQNHRSQTHITPQCPFEKQNHTHKKNETILQIFTIISLTQFLSVVCLSRLPWSLNQHWLTPSGNRSYLPPKEINK